jgi:hypothetical protein
MESYSPLACYSAHREPIIIATIVLFTNVEAVPFGMHRLEVGNPSSPLKPSFIILRKIKVTSRIEVINA